ncbi:unnamed protein product [Meganyctiphanes norvegica]|uniref:4'-phosphopantetheine phosphatase n=1 Tax=Meganyctiphanes norvegica TaxID=48144 RepID=A0AAV2RWV0_MEGNR
MSLQKVKVRPWLHDDLDAWINRRLTGIPYKCAVIFLDNSGCDVVLGILPFAWNLLEQGTLVVLCANSRPALNDVTALELDMILKQVDNICPSLRQYRESDKLIIRESGQASPCLDLSRIPETLVEELIKWGCDLVVIEGMGRALHTNLDVSFTCDTLKLAVIKNRWLANRSIRFKRPSKVT